MEDTPVMGIQNSLSSKSVQTLLDLYCNLVKDVAEATMCPTKEVALDLKTIRSRVTTEGISFLTKSLPSLGKAFDRALASDAEPMTVPSTFKKCKKRGVPVLFRWLFSKVLLPSLVVKRDADIECLRHIRQLCTYMYKVEMSIPEATKEKFLADFEQTDGELGKFRIIRSDYIKDCSRFINDVFNGFDHLDITPRHGPGAVATGEKNYEKHNFRRIYSAVEKIYPFTDYFQYSLSNVCDAYRSFEDLESQEAGITKVVLVPKDSRGPRLISCEPLEYQWIQQGLGRAVMAHLEGHPFTRGRVNFSTQEVNRALALSSSADQEWVTLDMKEASDRIGVDLVRHLFGIQEPLLNALLATRSPETMLPSGRTMRLNKFATMGSCLCFPVQSIVFYALAVCAIKHAYGVGRRKALDAVRVFGDDLIVRRDYYPAVLQYLPTVGLKFNEAKCCTAGSFRESCGCDAYNGIDVTPLRLRKVWDQRRLRTDTLETYVDHGNMAYARGYKRVASFTAALVEAELGALPTTSEKRGYLSLIRPVRVLHPGHSRMRFDKNTQSWMIRAWTSRPTVKSVDPDAWSMVLRRHKGQKEEMINLFPMPSASDGLELGTFAVSRRNCLHREWRAV